MHEIGLPLCSALLECNLREKWEPVRWHSEVKGDQQLKSVNLKKTGKK